DHVMFLCSLNYLTLSSPSPPASPPLPPPHILSPPSHRSIPFTTDEIVHSLPEINLDEVEPPPDLQDDPTFHFLLPLTSIPSVPSTPTAASHTPRNASPHLPPPSVPSSIPRSASLSHAHSRPGTAPAPHPMGGTPRGTGVSSVTSTPRVPSSPWDYFRGRGAWKSDDA
ncbi:unnamed protein product, partial [Closterium sp. NIES-54]